MKFISERRRGVSRRRRRFAVSAGIATLAVMAVGGMLLPEEFTSSRSRAFDRTPETVWRVLTDLDGMPLWRSDLTTLERLPSHAGRTVWREVGRNESRVIEFSLAEPPHRLVTQGSQSGRPGYPMRIFDLVATDRGTRVTITDRAAVPNPMYRVLVRLSPGRSSAQRFLRDLDQRLAVTRRQVTADGMQ